MNQLDLFGTAAPSPARRQPRADTALLLAMSADHITAAAAPGRFAKQVEQHSDTGRAIISRANAARDAMLLTPEWREMVKSWGKPAHDQPPSNAMRLHLAAIEQAIAEGDAAEEPQDEDDCEGYSCTDCALEFRGGGYAREDGQGKRCHWCHREHNATPLPAETFKDAREAYSADVIAMQGRTRAPFRFDGADWITTSCFGRKGAGVCESYRLAPDDGSAVSYNDWDWDTMRGSAMGGYHGMAAKVRGQAMRLVGPPRTFSEAPPAAPTML